MVHSHAITRMVVNIINYLPSDIKTFKIEIKAKFKVICFV